VPQASKRFHTVVGSSLEFGTHMKIHVSFRALTFYVECETVKRDVKQEIHSFGNYGYLSPSLERYENNSKIFEET
jgi:hypothetical protein